MKPWLDGLSAEIPLILAAAGGPLLLMSLVAVVFSVPLRQVLLPLFAVAVLGAVAGLAGGNARTGVVGDVIPAALALIGTVSIYVFGAKPDNGPVVAVAAAAFALALGLGYAAGAGKRGPLDAVAQNFAFCEDLFSDPKLYDSDAALARAADIFGNLCGNAFGFSHDKTVVGSESASKQSYFRTRFQAAAARGGLGQN